MWRNNGSAVPMGHGSVTVSKENCACSGTCLADWSGQAAEQFRMYLEPQCGGPAKVVKLLNSRFVDGNLLDLRREAINLYAWGHGAKHSPAISVAERPFGQILSFDEICDCDIKFDLQFLKLYAVLRFFSNDINYRGRISELEKMSHHEIINITSLELPCLVQLQLKLSEAGRRPTTIFMLLHGTNMHKLVSLWKQFNYLAVS